MDRYPQPVRAGKTEEIADLDGQTDPPGHMTAVLPQPPMQTLTFWLVGDGVGHSRASRRPSAQPDGDRARRLGDDCLIDSATGCAGYSLMPAGAGFRTVRPRSISRPITSHTGRVRADTRRVADPPDHLHRSAGWTSQDDVLAHGTYADGRRRGKMDPSGSCRSNVSPNAPERQEVRLRVLVDRLWPCGLHLTMP